MERTVVLICTYFLLASMLVCAETMETCASPQYVIMGEIGTIQCNFSAGFFGIFWYNTTDYINEYSVLNLKESGISGPGYTSGEFDIHPNGSLVIKDVTLAHNRNFTVVKLDSAFQEVVPHFVTVVVQAFPTPPYPIIEGCEQQKSCAVKVAHRGNLTCSVLGIHPQVELAWEIPREETSVNLIRTSQHTERRPRGTFDVHLKSEFFINDTSLYSQNVKCKVIWTKGEPALDIQSKVFLLFPEENAPLTEPTYKTDVEDSSFQGLLILIVAIVLVAVAVTAVVGIFATRRAMAKRKSSSTQEKDAESQLQPLLERPAELNELIEKLKKKYEEIYNSTQPLADIRRKNELKKVFIESDLQFLNFREGSGKHGVWESVESVESVLKNEGLRSKKFIIEGDHGYIKSTLGVELAYDWCTKDRSSFMKEFEVLIYLKLSQVSAKILASKGLNTILLGSDNTENEKGVEEICARSSSVAVLLDGFNFFPPETGDSSRNLDKLISSPSFEKHTVILLSAPPLLENVYNLGDMKRIRVSGTNKQTRDEFISRTFATFGTLAADEKSTSIEKNDDNAESNVQPMEEIKSSEKDTGQEKDVETVENSTPMEEEKQEKEKSVDTNKSPQNEGDYTEKVTIPKEESDTTKRTTAPEEHSIIPMDILVNPYLFKILTQTKISWKAKSTANWKSITKFFEQMLNYLERETNSEKEIGLKPSSDKEIGLTPSSEKDIGLKPNQQILHKIAFESITFNTEETKFWNKIELSEQMGSKFYESCKQLGYFIEEGVQCKSTNATNDNKNQEAQVRFSNTFLCEWFAAHHIIHMRETSLTKTDKKHWEDVINKLVSGGYWYCLRFLCGLDKDLGEKILKATKNRSGIHFFCALEVYDGITHTLDRVKKIFPKENTIKLKDSKLDVMALLQLLDTGARNQIKISRLVLENCFNGPSTSSELLLKSGVELPLLNTLADLEIFEEGRTLTETETNAIFNYAVQCNHVQNVKLSKCLLPKDLGDMSLPSDLEERNLKVKWKPFSKMSSFLLDLKNHQWKNDKGVFLTNDEYGRVVKKFHDLV